MKGSFFEFNVAISGLFTARGGLETTAHNIANAAAPGYSRQYVEQRAQKPLTFYDGKGMVGTGSEIYGIGQMRSFYLDCKYWSERAGLGEHSLKQSQLSMIEATLNELAGTGLSGKIDEFFNVLEDLSTTAGDPTYRTNFIKSAESLTQLVNSTATALRKQQRDANEDLRTVVENINSIGGQLVSLNRQISLFELDGSKANDLRDQRARLVDELSKYVNLEVREVERNEEYAAGLYPNPEDRGLSNKTYTVLINGYEFVNHYTVNMMEVVPRQEKTNPMDEQGLYDVSFVNSGMQFDLYHPHLQGEIKGIVDIRDGNNAQYFTGINYEFDEPTLTMIEVTKTDINPRGTIVFTNPEDGMNVTYSYEGYEYDPESGEATMEIILPDGEEFPEYIAYADVTIGKTTAYKGIPHYLDKLNQFVRTFAKAMNEGLDRNNVPIQNVTGHIYGYDMYGNQGNRLFTYAYLDPDDGSYRVDKTDEILNYDLLTCDNFMLNPDLLSDQRKLAAAMEYPVAESDNNVILNFLNVKASRELFAEGKISDFIVGMSGELGIDVKQATKFELNYTYVTETVDIQRMSISGVDLNEELVNMVKYQQLYQAAARLINVIDGIYDTVINRLGA